MELIREEYGLTALRLGYSQESGPRPRPPEVTCSLRTPGSADDEWSIPADAVPALGEHPDRAAWPATWLDRLRRNEGVRRLGESGDPLWLAVTAEHPLLPGVPWEDVLAPLEIPVLRLPPQLNTMPTTPRPRPRVVVWMSMPRAKQPFTGDVLVREAVRAIVQQQPDADVHVFADASWARELRAGLGPGATVHDPEGDGPHAPAPTAWRPGGGPGDQQPWLAWIADRTEGRIDVLHLIGHGYLATGQGAFAVAESPDRNHDGSTARFVWPQQIASFMTTTGAWGLVVTAAAGNYSTAGLRLLAAEVSALRSAATAHHEVAETEPFEALLDAYRLLLAYPARPPHSTRGLMLIMHPGRFGLEPPPRSGYRPVETELGSWVDSGEELPAWMVGAQRQVRQWETELCFDATSEQLDATRSALEVAKSRLDEVVRGARQEWTPGDGGAS